MDLNVLADVETQERIFSRALGGCIGAVFVLAMALRRLRAARRGRPLERHFQWHWLPVSWALLWLLPVAGIVALVRDGSAMLEPVAALAVFSLLWAAIGVVVWLDRRVELRSERAV